METYKNDLSDEILESQKYRIRAFLVPKLGNHAKSSELSIEFINVNALSEVERNSYEQGVTFIKGDFNVTLHTKCWKYYSVRPREIQSDFKGEYVAFVEGVEGYLYSHKWVCFLIEKLKNNEELTNIRQQII